MKEAKKRRKLVAASTFIPKAKVKKKNQKRRR